MDVACMTDVAPAEAASERDAWTVVGRTRDNVGGVAFGAL